MPRHHTDTVSISFHTRHLIPCPFRNPNGCFNTSHLAKKIISKDSKRPENIIALFFYFFNDHSYFSTLSLIKKPFFYASPPATNTVLRTPPSLPIIIIDLPPCFIYSKCSLFLAVIYLSQLRSRTSL